MPLQVACRTVSMPLHATSCHFTWRMPLQVACRTVSMPLAATSCHFMPLQVAVAPWASHFMPLHATSSGGRTVTMPLHATWREVAKSVYAPPASSMSFMIKSAKLQHWLSACHGACHACGDWHHSKLGFEQKGNKGPQRTIMSGNSRAVDDRQSMRGLTHPICTSVPHQSAASHTWILFFFSAEAGVLGPIVLTQTG